MVGIPPKQVKDNNNNNNLFTNLPKVGLWSVWLCGFALILVSVFETQLLPSLIDHQRKTTHKLDSSFSEFSVTIFSAPKPFVGVVGGKQLMAVKSWLALSTNVEVVLFAQRSILVSPAVDLDERVSVETDIDFTFLGTPFVHAMFARSRASSSDISVLIDSESILLPNFITTLGYCHRQLEHDWLLYMRTPTIDDFPFHLHSLEQQWQRENGKIVAVEEVLVQFQNWNCSDRILWAWNTGELPLHAGVLPPFLYGKGLYNEWIMNEALSSQLRFMFDATDTSLSFSSVSLTHRSEGLSEGSAGRGLSMRNWENEINVHLAASYGSLKFKSKSVFSTVPRLVKHGNRLMFLSALEDDSFVQWEYFRKMKQYHMLKKVRRFFSRHRKMIHKQMEISVLRRNLSDWHSIEKIQLGLESPGDLSLPSRLDDLLERVADKEKSVVLAVVGNNYRDMLMSWVCRLRRLAISNFIISALDYEVYQFSIIQGLPVFLAESAPSDISFNDCHFGTKCFQRVTKVKSRTVLKILKLGYNVLMSDVDVYWFKNPLLYLRSFGPTVIVAQSDEFNETVPINLPRRLNSGFYFVHSDVPTIAAMEKVVKHALTSNLSEQPSFYDTLCGLGGINRVGDNKCLEPDLNVSVHFLDRNLFPNGAYKGLWMTKNVRKSCLEIGCITIHNNWISGRRKKLQRHVSSGLWEYDEELRLCRQSWQSPNSSSWL